MSGYSDEQLNIIEDIAINGGSMVVPMDVVRGPVIALYIAGIIDVTDVQIGRLELRLTEKGWSAAQDVASP